MNNAPRAPYVAIVDQIHALKQRYPHADISGLEKTIDEFVSKLYGVS